MECTIGAEIIHNTVLVVPCYSIRAQIATAAVVAEHCSAPGWNIQSLSPLLDLLAASVLGFARGKVAHRRGGLWSDLHI